MMMKRALLAVAVAMIAITSCGGSGKQVVGTFCRAYPDDNRGWGWATIGRVWLVFSDGSSSQLEGVALYGVACFAGVSG